MRAKIWFFFLVLAAVFVVSSLALDCPPTNVAPTPAEADPNLINYKLLCERRYQANKMVSIELTACDPDSDPMGFQILQGPPGMTISQVGGVVSLNWLTVEGIFYVDVEVFDRPPDPNDSLSDRGSIVFIIRKANQPPIFGGCR